MLTEGLFRRFPVRHLVVESTVLRVSTTKVMWMQLVSISHIRFRICTYVCNKSKLNNVILTVSNVR